MDGWTLSYVDLTRQSVDFDLISYLNETEVSAGSVRCSDALLIWVEWDLVAPALSQVEPLGMP